VNAVICDHKDCERTDATPLELELYSRDKELIDTRTFHFCPQHRAQLFALEETKTLPPAEWFGETSGP
jgi:hypothetical protein